MAKYTEELGVIVNSGTQIFNFPYAFHDPAKKAEFERMFVSHFFFREIGQETVGRFKHYLRVKFDEVLPYYNMLFLTAQIEYDKTNNYIMDEVHDRNKDTTGTATQTGSNTDNSHTDKTINRDSDSTTTENNDKTSTAITDDRKVKSDTPTNLLTMPDIKANMYASEAEIVDGNVNVHDVADGSTVFAENTGEVMASTILNTGEITTESEAIHNEKELKSIHTFGNTGFITVAEMLQKHITLQKTLTTIYGEFFNKCDDLFMQIY